MSKSTLLQGKQVETRKHMKLALNNVILITPTTEINIESEYRKIKTFFKELLAVPSELLLPLPSQKPPWI